TLACGAAFAQGFTGAELSGQALAFSETNDIGQTAYRAAAEFGITRGIGVAADLGYYGFPVLGSNETSLGLHGVYGLNNDLALGMFYTRDSLDGGSVDSYGIEGATSVVGAQVEGYFGMIDGLTGGNAMFGVSGSYDITPAISATAGFGAISGDNSRNRASIGGQYQISGGPAVFAELGRLTEAGDSSGFLSLGASIAIGPQGGTTFGSRSIYDILR
ncbi:hypothetical protein GW813_15360, partial [bacterium]|nr:hypothetical protein [bacterium]